MFGIAIVSLLWVGCGGREDCTYYLDLDGDGYGNTATGVVVCEPGDGYVALDGDCDDGHVQVFPGAPERCDGLDNDCDGIQDESSGAWYTDSDGDGYGDPLLSVAECDGSSGLLSNGDDCLDSDPTIHPGAVEACDLLDNDCDGDVDEGLETQVYYPDRDGDGYGAETEGLASCMPPPGWVEDGGDCADSNSWAYPGSLKACFWGTDGDCDGEPDSCQVALRNTKVFHGEREPDTLGLSVSGAGDVNGDGLADVLVGAPGRDDAEGQFTGDDHGIAYLLLGPVEHLDIEDADAYFADGRSGSKVGWMVGAAGDVDGDGLADVLVGGDDGIHVFHGPVGGRKDMDGPADARLYRATSAVGLGDTDGDGIDDLAFVSGNLYLERGPFSGDVEADRADLEFSDDDGFHRYSGLSAAGDVNGDGLADLLCSDRLFVDLSGSKLRGDEAVAHFYGPGSSSSISKMVGAGDVNGDGYLDVAVADEDHRVVGTDGKSMRVGAAYIFYGPISGDVGLEDANATVLGDDHDDLGASLAGAGDLNGDGFADVLVGSPRSGVPTDVSDRGVAYVLLGPLSGVQGADLSLRMYGGDADDRAGKSVSFAGDVNGDGRDEVLIGAPYDDTSRENAGAVYLVSHTHFGR